MVSREPREPTRFERWAWSPISAYRLGLTLSYIAMVYFGVQAFIAGVPAFIIAAPEGWTPIWASILVLGGIVATIGSAGSSKRFERVETWGAWALFLTLATYAITLLVLAYGNGDNSRAAVGAGFVALGIMPLVRLLWLMSQLGRKKAAPEPSNGEQGENGYGA
jgi:uncharacterized membrane protein YhdT